MIPAFCSGKWVCGYQKDRDIVLDQADGCFGQNIDFGVDVGDIWFASNVAQTVNGNELVVRISRIVEQRNGGAHVILDDILIKVKWSGFQSMVLFVLINILPGELVSRVRGVPKKVHKSLWMCWICLLLRF